MTGESAVAEPPRIRPELALQPGTADPRNLLIVWYLRKAVYGLVALGLIGGAVTKTNLEVNWKSGAELGSQLSSPLAPIVVGLEPSASSTLTTLQRTSA